MRCEIQDVVSDFSYTATYPDDDAQHALSMGTAFTYTDPPTPPI